MGNPAAKGKVLAKIKSRGHVDHGDLDELRKDLNDDEVTDILAAHFRTPEGQTEMAKAGRGGMDPKELARLVVKGR